MILPDFEINTWGLQGGIEPFNPENVNPASIDLTLGESYIDLETGEELGGSFVLEPGQAILATTVEYIKLPPRYAASVYLKSSLARNGLDHALAGWVDPGFEGNLTLELHSHRPIKLSPGERIIQLVLLIMYKEPESPYIGRYQGQRGPTRARTQTDCTGSKIALK